MKTAVRILRGKHRGRTGSVSGTLADRIGKGIEKALVHLEGEPPDFYALSSLEEVRQLSLLDPTVGDTSSAVG